MDDITHAICHASPTRGNLFIFTDDLETARIQVKNRPSKRTRVIMIDADDATVKAHIFEDIIILPLGGYSTIDEIFRLVKGR